MIEHQLTTKFHIPLRRSHLVSRPRLLERLDEGLIPERKLTLLSAPAGYGKSTLVSMWIRERELQAAWLSLEEADNDPARFLVYLVAALRRVEEGLGREIEQALHSAQPPPLEALLTALINELARLSEALTLVLDDYHLISAQPVHDAVAFLLDHLPRNAHLVIVTRLDPPLPLARLRGRGQLNEVRQADLAFDGEETAAFLAGFPDLTFSPDEIRALERRTEGWITGLQLAALSLRGREDVSPFIAAFSGSHRYVLDYLVEEVLERQPESVRSFLLQTSVLERLCGPLCDAVTLVALLWLRWPSASLVGS